MQTDLKAVINVVGDLPPMPVVAIKVLELLQDPMSSSSDLAKAIALDPAVSARILKIANSSFYGMQRQIKTLQNAIVILGEKTLRSLVLAISLKAVNKRFGLIEKMLWEDSIGCAIGARLLSQELSIGDREESFLGGLFHNIGKVVRNNNNADEFRQIVEAEYNGEGSFSKLELNYFDHAHTVVGAAVLEKWNFATGLIQCALHHNDLNIDKSEDSESFNLTCLVALSSAYCRKLGIGRREPDEDFDIASAAAAKALKLPGDRVEELLKKFENHYEESREFFMG